MDFSAIPLNFWITLGTIISTIILGQLSKKSKFVSGKIIPLQNLFIGVFVCFVQYLITKDLNAAVAISGLMSGGIYDLSKSISKVFSNEEE